MIRKIVIIHCILLLTGTASLYAQSAPVLGSLEGTNLIYSEDDPPVLLTNTIQLTGEAAITRAVVQIAGNYVAGQDQLIFSDTEEIWGVFNEESGTLLLLSYPAGTGRSPISFQNALRTVSYRNTNDANPQAGLREISFQVFNEQNQGSNPLTRNLSVLAKNDAPKLTLPNDAPINYVPGSGLQTPVFEGLTVADRDNNSIESAEITISEGFKNSEDQLTLNAVAEGISISGSGSRTITLIGPAPAEAYQNALRDVQFSNTLVTTLDPTIDNRKITAIVNDGDAQSLGISRFVAVGNTNVPPEINPVAKTTTTETEISFTQSEFTDQYRDPEGNTSFTGIFIRSKPRYGTLLFQGNEVNNSSINAGLFVASGEFSDLVYRPSDDFTGEDEFLWNASDGANFAANNVAVTVTVLPPELLLTLVPPEPVTTEENTETTLPPLVLTTSQNVSVTVTLSVTNGTVSLPAELISGLSFSSGDGTADPTMVFTGNAQTVAYLLSGLRYLPGNNYSGPDELSVSISATSDVSAQEAVAITVVPGDDPFQLSNLESEPLNYTENDPPVTLTDQITIEDINSESNLRIASAVIAVTEGYVPGEDSLGFAPLLGIEGSQQDNVLTLTGVSDIISYQTALQTVTYRNTSDNPATAKTIAFTVFDEADSASNTVSRSIIIQPVEDPPQLLGLESFPMYHDIANDTSPLSNALSVLDPESNALDQVVVSFSEGYNPSLDSLYFDGTGDIVGVWNDERGILALQGESTAEAYTLALRAVRYRNNSPTPDETPRTLSIQAFNGDVGSNLAARSIVLVTNDPPTVSDFEVTTTIDIPYAFTLTDFTANYSDSDNAPIADQPIEIRLTALPTNGSLVYRDDTILAGDLESAVGGYVVAASDIEDGLLRYVPTTGFTGPDAIRWNAYDGAEIAESDAGIRINVLEALAITLNRDSVVVCSGATDTLGVRVASAQAEVTYAWSCVGTCGFTGPIDQPTVTINPTQTTHYIISVTAAGSTAPVQDSVVVVVDDCSGIALTIPSGFTPDADQVNDVWVIENAEVVPSLTVEVFDRNGHSVYRSEDYQNDWDGTFEGELLPVGTYYYLITRPEGQTYKGALSILR